MANTKYETHTAVFTTANKSELKDILRKIQAAQNSFAQRAYNYFMTFISFIHASTGVISIAGMAATGTDLEALEDFYTKVLMRVDSCSYIRVTQEVVGNYMGANKGYVYTLKTPYMQQY